MDIDKLTIGEARQIAALLGNSPAILPTHPYEIGKAIFVRTVTYHATGILKAVHAQELVLDQASWVADSGRFASALKSGDFSEEEPFPGDLIIGRGSIVDATHVPYTNFPRSQK